MSLSQAAARFLRILSRVEAVSSPADVDDIARRERYTGPVTTHYIDGVPKRIDVGRPIQIEVIPLAVAAPAPRKLTTPTESAQTSV